jgi:hypothetical protein
MQNLEKKMSVNERSRIQLAEALKRVLGPDEGVTLMELLPPVGWADVATKHDLLMQEDRMDARFESLEGRMNARFENLEVRLDARFENLEVRFEAGLENLENRMEARFERGFRQVAVTTATLIATGFVATVVAVAVR